MAYREHGMWEVFDVLKRIHRGESVRAVSRTTGRERKTVKRYVAAAEAVGWVPGVHAPDEALAEEVLGAIRPVSRGTSPGETERLLAPHLERIKEWLAPRDGHRRGLRLSKVHAILRRLGVEVSYSSLRRFAIRHLDFGREGGTVRVADVEPGELAEVDFGRLGLVPDSETGKQRVLYALIVTLVCSRHQYVHLTHQQKLPDLIEGLEDAWEFFGGVARRVVLDNLKAAVTKPDRYDPTFQRTFEQYAEHRGFVIDAAVPKHPKGKPHVERQVPYVRENFFRGERFLSRDHAQREAVRWCLTTAGLRIHGTTRRQPLREFEQVEQPALQPLAGERFDPPAWAEPTVHPDFHIQFGCALYSVPYRYRGKKTTVRADSKLVRIYVAGRQVKIHPTQPPGGRHTDPEDYPPEKTEYAMRDTDRMIRNAAEFGDDIGLFTAKLLSGTYPWASLRQAQKLMHLVDKYGAPRVDAACGRALRFDVINTGKVQKIIEDALDREKLSALRPGARPPRGQVIQMPLRFMRDPQSFRHEKPPQKEEK
jgi:transposase